MGQTCTGKREKLDRAGRYTKHLAVTYKQDLSEKYANFKEDAREKYEHKMFNYRIQKSKTGTMGKESFI